MNIHNPVTLHDAEQGTDEWHALRCGFLTASAVKEIVTPTLKLAANDKTRALVNKIAVQRITGEPEESYTTYKMLRGHIDEGFARQKYARKYDEVQEVGFITNAEFPNFGYSPDGLVGDDGLIEVKSRDPHLHLSSIIAHADGEAAPKEFMAQIQAGLLISGRKWCDFLSFSHGLPMLRSRVFRDEDYIAALTTAAEEFEETVLGVIKTFEKSTADVGFFTPTERIDYDGMIL